MIRRRGPQHGHGLPLSGATDQRRLSLTVSLHSPWPLGMVLVLGTSTPRAVSGAQLGVEPCHARLRCASSMASLADGHAARAGTGISGMLFPSTGIVPRERKLPAPPAWRKAGSFH